MAYTSVVISSEFSSSSTAPQAASASAAASNSPNQTMLLLTSAASLAHDRNSIPFLPLKCNRGNRLYRFSFTYSRTCLSIIPTVSSRDLSLAK